MTIRVETKTTATLTADAGRMIGWSVDREPGHVSLAIPTDRAKLNPVQLRELAQWLLSEAERIAPSRPKAAPGTTAAGWRVGPTEKALRDALLSERVRTW